MGKLRKKKLNKKGFTLIELLAVIVILAVLILLALPRVLDTMENAQKKAFETEVRTYLKAAQTKYTTTAIDGAGVTSFSDSGTQVDVEGKTDYHYNIQMNLTDDGTTYSFAICSNNYYASASTATPININGEIKIKKIGDTGVPACNDSIAIPASESAS